MLAIAYAALLVACSSSLFIFGFFVGRCARKMPILDYYLPWTLHRGQVGPAHCDTASRCPANKVKGPEAN